MRTSLSLSLSLSLKSLYHSNSLTLSFCSISHNNNNNNNNTAYTCLDSKLRGGKIYLSPNYVCFGAHFPRIQGEADVVMPIKDIMMLKKVLYSKSKCLFDQGQPESRSDTTVCSLLRLAFLTGENHRCWRRPWP